jgi:hypothetical protein
MRPDSHSRLLPGKLWPTGHSLCGLAPIPLPGSGILERRGREGVTLRLPYHGEDQVAEEDLQSFLHLAGRLGGAGFTPAIAKWPYPAAACPPPPRRCPQADLDTPRMLHRLGAVPHLLRPRASCSTEPTKSPLSRVARGTTRGSATGTRLSSLTRAPTSLSQHRRTVEVRTTSGTAPVRIVGAKELA